MDTSALRRAHMRASSTRRSIVVGLLLLGALAPVPAVAATLTATETATTEATEAATAGATEAATATATEAATVTTALATATTDPASTTSSATTATLVVRAGAERRPDGTVRGLAGASFAFYGVASESQLTGGTFVGGCTTAQDGRCSITALLPQMDNGHAGYFYAVQTAAPAGWTAAGSWGTGTDLVRYNTGLVRGSSTVAVPDEPRWWPHVRTNPAVNPTCGLDVAVVVDLSDSIARRSTPAFNAYKDAATALVDALEGTPSTLSVYNFATSAPANGPANRTLEATSVLTAPGAQSVREKLRGLTATPNPVQGYANWDLGLAQAVGRGHDVVVLLTDGEPTADRGTLDGTPVDLAKVEEAVHSANGLKAGGARVVVVGVTEAASAANVQRLGLLSGPGDSSVTAQVNQASALLRAVAAPLTSPSLDGCTGDLSVAVRTGHVDGAQEPATGWTLSAAAPSGASVTPSTATTGADGTATFSVTGYGTGLPAQRVTITPTVPDDYTIEPQDGANATCVAGGTALLVTSTDVGFAVDVPAEVPVLCTIVARPPSPAVQIVTTSSVDTGDGIPSVVSGTEVTWFYTVTNTGDVELTNLHVTDDHGRPVACPASPGAAPTLRGNPIPVLAPGESLTCTTSGPVTSLPTS